MSENSENAFFLPKTQYRRDLNILRTYVEDSAKYLEKMTGKPFDECVAFVKNSVAPGGEFEFKDPPVLYLERDDKGDRTKQTGTLSQYLGEAIREQDLIAPTLTTYYAPHKKQSLLVDFIDGNVKARSAAKKAMFAAMVAGDTTMQIVKNIEQTNRKLSNNSISGAHVSASTPLYNPTAHSTLTSNCRSTSGYGNANNEKFLCGNRHYWSPDLVRNNIISVINHSDYSAIEAAMVKYGIRAPTIAETMECITHSTKHYWRSEMEYGKLYKLVSSLSDLERATFVYTGDMYHLRKCNEEVVRTFLTRLSRRIPEVHPDPAKACWAAPEDYVHLACMLCPQEMKGTDLRKVVGTPAYGIVASTVVNIQATIEHYFDMIRALWVTPNVPASVAFFPDSLRHAAVTSDTDSTIFTVQEWVEWHQGRVGFDDECNRISDTMIFLAAQGITHILARMSANFGIEESRLHQIAMKNEYKFNVFTPTQVAKHYFALIGAQEGNLFAAYKKEIKGVHLKSSNAPKRIMQEAERMMVDIMNTIIKEEKVSLAYILKWIADIERDVVESIKKGSHEYFRKGQIKNSESYTKNADESPYINYAMWEDVFAEKYGPTQAPPYICVKVSTGLDTPTKTKLWLEEMKDRALAARMEKWMLKYKGKICTMTTFQLPEQVITSVGIPQEILDVVGVRKIVLDTTKVFYIILETLGVYMLNNKTTRLVSDTH